MNQNGVLKLSATRNAIRNKFKKAYTNRIEREEDVNLAMKPLTAAPAAPTQPTTSVLEPQKEDSSPHHHRYRQLKSLPKKTHCDSNELCNKLRFLLTSQLSGNAKHTREIGAIVKKLREQKIVA